MRKEFQCFWKQACGERTCCHFCNNKKCEFRCNDNTHDCRFKDYEQNAETVQPKNEVVDVKIKTHNETVDKDVVKQLSKYKKEHHLNNKKLAEQANVPYQSMNKAMNEPNAKIRSDTYRKIKEFAKSTKSLIKKSLW